MWCRGNKKFVIVIVIKREHEYHLNLFSSLFRLCEIHRDQIQDIVWSFYDYNTLFVDDTFDVSQLKLNFVKHGKQIQFSFCFNFEAALAKEMRVNLDQILGSASSLLALIVCAYIVSSEATTFYKHV